MCEAFAEGVRAAGGSADVCTEPPLELQPGAAAFYGVRPPVMHLWRQAKRERRDWYYIDNAYFDRAREKFFRITRNALQCDGLQAVWNGEGPARLAALGIQIRDWQRGGSHIVVCPQSEEFMRGVGEFGRNWLAEATAALRAHTDRPLRIREKGERRPLAEDRKNAWALVTHMSCAAVEALLAGVPVFCTGRSSAQWMGSADLTAIETPYRPEGRREWAELLAANQWTLEEIRAGAAWRALNPSGINS